MKIRTSAEYRQRQQRKRAALHYQVAGWAGSPGECGAECACGTTYDGFDRLADADEHLDRHIAGRRDRAMGPTAPLSMAVRVGGYYDQTGLKNMTPAQRRRAYKKHRQAAERYELARGAA